MNNPITPVVKVILSINIVVFLAQYLFSMQDIYLEQWGALWSFQSGNFKVYQLITYLFMHSQALIFHIIFNMLTLWMFGPILEQVWGGKRFLQFYMLCGVVSGIAQLLQPGVGIAVGASGAIMGLMAAFAYLFPNTPLQIMFIPIPIKAKIAIPLLMLIDLFGGVLKIEGDTVAHWAHLGGALTGFLLVFIWNKTNRRNFY